MYKILFCVCAVVCVGTLWADMSSDEKNGYHNRSLRHTVSDHQDDASAPETLKNVQDEAELEQASFTPSKHKKERQKSKGLDKARDASTHRIHKEGEDLEKVSLKEQSLHAGSHGANTIALSFLFGHTLPQHIEVSEIADRAGMATSLPFIEPIASS